MGYNNIASSNFPAITSQPNRPATWALRLLLWLGVIAVFFCIYAIPAAFVLDPHYDTDREKTIVTAIIVYSILLSLTWWLVRYVRSQKAKAIIEITVDEKGLHKKRLNGSIDSVLYKDLQKNTNPYKGGDVYAETRPKGASMLKIKLSTETIVVFATDITYSYFTGNMFELRAHFIRGIRTVRPDLKIADSVFSTFYINRDDFSFDKKSYRKTILMVTVLLLIITACVAWYVNMRTNS